MKQKLILFKMKFYFRKAKFTIETGTSIKNEKLIKDQNIKRRPKVKLTQNNEGSQVLCRKCC